MRLAISNIAWDVAEDETIAKLLHEFSVDAIDVAPGKYFPEPAKASAKDLAGIRLWWADKGIEITGMQALLFGTTGLNVFGDSKSQKAMLEHLRNICRIGAGLHATRLVFGSPKNRDRSGLSDPEATAKAVAFFTQLGNAAEEHGVVVCLEPNPTQYGANFMTNSAETAQVVDAVAHSSIKMQFDTGSLSMNNESAEVVLGSYANLIGHVHASEPQLLPLGSGGTDHKRMSEALVKHLPEKVVCVEMVATKEESHLGSIRRALSCAVENYRPKG